MRTYSPIKSRCIVLRKYYPLISHKNVPVCPLFKSSGGRKASVIKVVGSTLTELWDSAYSKVPGLRAGRPKNPVSITVSGK